MHQLAGQSPGGVWCIVSGFVLVHIHPPYISPLQIKSKFNRESEWFQALGVHSGTLCTALETMEGEVKLCQERALGEKQ